MKNKSILVIGAGASGLMAAAAASAAGASVTVLEQNEKAGKKIYITGKGRCNLTNDCATSDFFDHVVTNPKFLYHSVHAFDHDAVKAFFTQAGCPVKTERGERVFPVSDHASDVTKALTRTLQAQGGRILTGMTCRHLQTESGKITGVRLSDGSFLAADAVILCTGGRSYASTGSDGSGYLLAQEAGHTVMPQEPSLVPFVTKESWPTRLSGLSLRNVAVSVWPLPRGGEKQASPEPPANGRKQKKKKDRAVYEGFGEMLFTQQGVSGPLVLTASTRVSFREHPEGYRLMLNLKPAVPAEELAARVDMLLRETPDRSFIHAASSLFPARLGREMILAAGLDPDLPAREVQEGDRRRFATCLQALPLTIVRTGGFPEAVVTRGGVSVKEINPSTMESKLVKGLYFAGEIIDVDAVTGGFNLQIAWSTGHTAGLCAAQNSEEA
ncbi:MAG: NAD(P)/FAD-dependent oxidoreductase [Lachnospiraceae bacterium]|jgi:predicted flavoprotein YhiN|nr:NAD(P)/FAD-dependent oxidoreductase [Lachnospiraceae bacterium]